MKIAFDGEDITISQDLKIGDINSITVTYLPSFSKYHIQVFGGKKRTKYAKTVEFNGVEFKKSKVWNCDKPYLHMTAKNGRYINYYPEGLNSGESH